MVIYCFDTVLLHYIPLFHHLIFRLFEILSTSHRHHSFKTFSTDNAMSFLALKVLKLGYSQAKKHRAKKQQQQQQEQFQQGHPVPYPDPYPMTEYPPGVAPGANVHYPPPAPAESASKSSKLASMFISALRFLQFVLGLTVLGLYGRDIHNNSKTQQSWPAKCYFALTTATLATITAVLCLLIPKFLRQVNSASNQAVKLPQFVWEFVLCILWLTMFGLFGKMFIGVYPASESGSNKRNESSTSTPGVSSSSSSGSTGTAASSAAAGLGDAAMVDRMRHAVWVDLISLALWVITASWVLLRWLKGRRAAGAAGGADEKV